MAKKVYVTVFQTMAGASATLITPLRWRRQAGTHKQSMMVVDGYEIWYSHTRQMSEKEAHYVAECFAMEWVLNGCPATGELRRAIEEGGEVLTFAMT